MAMGRAMEALAGVSQPLPPLQLAALGAHAERDYFGKPCGLLDQSAIACGSIVILDFENPDAPSVEPLDFDFEACGCAVVLVDVRCDHSEFTGEYAQLVNDMSSAAAFFGAERLCQVPESRYLAQVRALGRKCGDGVALRGLHYYNESRLVDARIAALRAGDLPAFLEATRRSGASSAQYLRNVWLPDSSRQPAMMALALADFMLGGHGAVRIHGGGFGGTIQAFVPHGAMDAFVAGMESTLGRGTCHTVQVVGRGAYAECAAGAPA
jgi:galactokinase